MTKFTKDNLRNDGGYVHFYPDGNTTGDCGPRFVARFKHMKRNMGPFCTFLRKNFTVEEYFARMDAGETPVAILRSKGYIPSHIKAWMRKAGYPTTPAGYVAWTTHQRKLADEETAKWRAANPEKVAAWAKNKA